MRLRFHIDPDTGQPHIYQHRITESEVEEVLTNADEDRAGREGAREAIGQATAGRYILLVYRPLSDSVFVITAYELTGNDRAAFRRRRRRRWRRRR